MRFSQCPIWLYSVEELVSGIEIIFPPDESERDNPSSACITGAVVRERMSGILIRVRRCTPRSCRFGE